MTPSHVPPPPAGTDVGRGFRVQHGLTLIDAAARACGVFDGRWVSASGEQAVAVVIARTGWLVHPVDTGWVAVRRDGLGRPDLTRTVWLQRVAGELRVPTTAWGRLLAGEVRVTDDRAVTPLSSGHRR